MVEKKLENIAASEKKDINLGRVAMNTFGYGFVGALFDNGSLIAPMTAALGLGLTLYDEVKQKGMNLTWPWAGILVGGLVGSLFDINHNEYIPNIISHGGAALGLGLGLYKSYINREEKESD